MGEDSRSGERHLFLFRKQTYLSWLQVALSGNVAPERSFEAISILIIFC